MSRFTDLLGDFSAQKRFLIYLEPYSIAASALVPLYYSSHGFVSEPSDTPANQYYEPRAQSALTFERSIFQSGKLSGRSIPGNGRLVLANPDGALDGLAAYAWGGRRARVWLGGEGFSLGDFGLIFDGTIKSIEFGDLDVTINLRDLAHLFDREMQTATFLGTGGNEGGSDLAGKRKPMALGVVRNVQPVYLGADTGYHKFSVNSGPIVGVLTVYDRGAELTYDPAPSPGEYSLDLDAGVITLGGAFDGPITCDIIGRRTLSVSSSTSGTLGALSGTFAVPAGQRLYVGQKIRFARLSDRAGAWMDGIITAYSGTALSVNLFASLGTGTFTDWTISPYGTVAGIQRSLAESMGVTLFDTAALSALEAAQPATIGHWIPEGGNGLTIMDAVADGSGTYWGFDRSGSFECGRLSAPAGTVASYDPSQTLEISRLATEDPNYSVTVRYKRNWNVFGQDQIAGIAAGMETYFTTEWREAVASNTAVLTAYPLSEAIIIESVFDDAADAAAEAARQLALFGVRRDYFNITLKVQPLGLENGQTISITHNRYGLSTGRALRVVDLSEDMDTFEVQLGAWG